MDGLQSFIFGVASLWICYRLFGPTAGTSEYFKKDFYNDWDIYRKISALLLVMALSTVINFSPRVSKIWKHLILYFSFSLCIYFVISIMAGWHHFHLFDANSARTTAIPLACLICLVCFLIQDKCAAAQDFSETSNYNSFLILISMALTISIFHDYKLTEQWNKSLTFLKSKISSEPGCENISVLETTNYLRPSGMDVVMPPAMSIILSQLQFNKIGTVMFSNSALEYFPAGTNFCCQLAKNNFPMYTTLSEIDPGWHFQIAPVIEAIRSQPEKYSCDK
ncbi:MAG: hypothetical protein H7256_01045 [Bdellovibrio sp.]|nr:hypothetical protein [Bdellovibrio sp.]